MSVPQTQYFILAQPEIQQQNFKKSDFLNKLLGVSQNDKENYLANKKKSSQTLSQSQCVKAQKSFQKSINCDLQQSSLNYDIYGNKEQKGISTVPRILPISHQNHNCSFQQLEIFTESMKAPKKSSCRVRDIQIENIIQNQIQTLQKCQKLFHEIQSTEQQIFLQKEIKPYHHLHFDEIQQELEFIQKDESDNSDFKSFSQYYNDHIDKDIQRIDEQIKNFIDYFQTLDQMKNQLKNPQMSQNSQQSSNSSLNLSDSSEQFFNRNIDDDINIQAYLNDLRLIQLFSQLKQNTISGELNRQKQQMEKSLKSYLHQTVGKNPYQKGLTEIKIQ